MSVEIAAPALDAAVGFQAARMDLSRCNPGKRYVLGRRGLTIVVGSPALRRAVFGDAAAEVGEGRQEKGFKGSKEFKGFMKVQVVHRG